MKITIVDLKKYYPNPKDTTQLALNIIHNLEQKLLIDETNSSSIFLAIKNEIELKFGIDKKI